ncbi:ferritin-like domain-containing protein [Streptacidiphilus melanogenes]|uniref:ferritin-like domain-containing protein n=1 Tax=Streptacidiphilus melanogenes TaxID=411235 RepID=UPI0006939FBD|nr:ferritin-like domain-containing protein [Streptacidiphilus melanogenes]
MTGSPTPTPTQAPLTVQVLQTAAALENLAVECYTAAAAMPLVTRGGGLLRDLVDRNRSHHAAHALAFNRALRGAGAARQTAVDARYAPIVRRRLARVTDPAALADLLTELENVNAQTCVRFATLCQDGRLRSLLVDTASVEAQHTAQLLIQRAFLDGGFGAEDAAPGLAQAAARTLPATAATAGIPYAAFPTAEASAINEGVVR